MYVYNSVCLACLQKYMHQIEYLLDLALLDDKRGRRSEASKMYSCAIEVALEAVSHQAVALTTEFCINF